MKEMEIPDGGHNPLDGYERFLKSRKARFQRLDSDSLSVDVDGHTLDLFWSEDDEALLCNCVMPMQFSETVRDLAAPIFMHINRRQWLGHFDLTDDGFPCFRYTMLFHGNSATSDFEMIEEMTEIAMRSCEQYSPAFELMAAAQTSAEFPRIIEKNGMCAPLGLALLDTAGGSKN
ncbi:MAG: YbjN domain-containing protein [Alphaproteobacteria bacterium]|nr:YbjN domain-containing protein [Alphaproteobacteria bacterium]